MSKKLLISSVSVVALSLILAIIGWAKYTTTNNKLNDLNSDHVQACRIISAQGSTITKLNHQLYPIGSSVTIDNGTVSEHSAGC